MDYVDYSDSDEDSNSSEGVISKAAPIRPKVTDLGKKVIFPSNDKKQKYGILRFVGETEFAEGVWGGVELDQPTGKNNGSIHGIRYFMCENSCGMFVPILKVELDVSRRVRSRPNTQPSSRATSVERNEPPSRPNTAKSSAAPSASKLGLNMQLDLVNRLAQPLKRNSAPNTATISRRQPMKAFGIGGREEVKVKENKKILPPFRSGGMYKASSTENIRSLKDKEKTKPGAQMFSQNMPVSKKFSSEKDLRNAGKVTAVKKSVPTTNTTAATTKAKWKQMRPNSCSDLLAPTLDPTSSTTSSTSHASSHISLEGTSCTSSHTSLEGTNHTSLEGTSHTSSEGTSHTSLEYQAPWPRTSTPGNRDELTPDGCSSPEDTVDDLKKRSMESTSAVNKGFMETPQTQNQGSESNKERPTPSDENLASHITRFTEAQAASPSLPHQSIQSPDQGGHAPRYYKNRPSGTATLEHPLTRSIVTEGAKLLKKLLGPNHSLEGVSVGDLVQLFEEQAKAWQSVVVDQECKLEQQQAKSKQLEDILLEAQKFQEAKVMELNAKHHEEISALHAAHMHAMEGNY